MGSCATCGESSSEGQRFCPSCGAAIQSVEFIGAQSAPVKAEHTVTRGGPDTKWYLLLGGLLTLVIGWSILTSSGADEATGDGETEAEVGGEGTTTDPPLDDEQEDTTSTMPSTSVEILSGDTFETDNGAATSDVLTPDPPVFLTDGPIGDTGLTLVTGSPLRLLDLDTGEVTETNLSGVSPIALIGDRLIVSSETSLNSVRALDINNLEEASDPFEAPNGYLFAFTLGDEPNTIVAIGDNYNSGPSLSRYVYDVATGMIIDETSVEVDFGFYGGWVSSGDFMTPRSGGVYRIVGDSFDLAGPGRVVAQGDGLVLVEECDGQLSCVFVWYDANYNEVTLPVPPGIADGKVTADGRLVVSRSTSQWEASLFDLESGEVIAEQLTQQGEQAISVSPDNKTVSYGRNGAIIILNLDTGEEHEVRFRVTFETSSLTQLLIETP